MPQTIYAVFKEGVYRHECLGLFKTLENAKSVADKAASSGHDHYHHFLVVPFELDKPTPFDGPPTKYLGPYFDEPEPVYRAR